MFDKLQKAKERLQQINDELTLGSVINDQNKYRDLMREHKNLSPVIEKFCEYERTKEEYEGAVEMTEDKTLDSELREMAQEEMVSAKGRLEALESELKVMLLPRDPNDDKNVIVEIRGGVGGEEAALFAGSLYRMYSMYAEAHRYKVEVLSINETDLQGIKEISFLIEGDGAYSRLKFESGVHRVQRVPETESSGRIHTSAVTVAVLPEVGDVEIELPATELQIETCRSSGAGGQHVNKTESAIRIVHIPTGLVVECQDERSQHKNKDRALKILRAKLYDLKLAEQQSKIASQRRSQVGSGDRSERVRTYNFPQGRVTDHRIGLTLYKLDAFLNGDLDEMIDALITTDNARKLQGESVD